MPRKGGRKRLKFRLEELSPGRVTVADFANSDPAVVKSGRVKKAVANAVQKEVKALCGLEASQVPVEEGLTFSLENGELFESCDEPDISEDNSETSTLRKKKSKRSKENMGIELGTEYPIDIWLVLASYIRPEDVGKFSLICKNAWTVSCTAVFWMRLYKRHYHREVYLPLRLQPECIGVLHCLRARVIRSLYHMYEPFSSRVSKNPTVPESTPSTLANSKCLLFWCRKIVRNRQDALWEFNFKFKTQQARCKNNYRNGIMHPPVQYEEVHTNREEDCCLLQVTTLNFIYIPIVMGMTLAFFTINVSTDMRHHRVRLLFHDFPVLNGKKPRGEQGVQVVLDPVHSVRLLDWWHPQYPFFPTS